MGDFRARKKPPPRGEGVAGLRGERQPLLGIAHQVCIPKRARDHEPIPRRRPVGSHGAVLPLMPEVRKRVAVVVLVLIPKVPLACNLDGSGDALLVKDVHKLAVALAVEEHGGVVRAVGFCCVCHANDSTGEPPPPQLHAASSSQATLPCPVVGSSLSGMPPTLGELRTLGAYDSSARRAASDIPRAHRMVVPATVYTWHTAAQVLRPASDMPHGSGRRACPRGRRAGHP
jgi:hypothetical protein